MDNESVLLTLAKQLCDHIQIEVVGEANNRQLKITVDNASVSFYENPPLAEFPRAKTFTTALLQLKAYVDDLDYPAISR